MRPAAYRLASLIEKRAASVSDLLALAKNNAGVTAGAIGGGLYGAYQGATGPEAGVGSTLLGATSGALGGGLLGHVAHRGGGALIGAKGEKGLLGQIGEARTEALTHAKDALGTEARQGMLADARNVRAYRASPEYQAIHAGMADVDSRAMSGLITPAEARQQIDALAMDDPVHNYERLKKQLLWGSIGSAMATSTGLGLVANSGAGAASNDEQIRATLLDKYQRTGKLDPREMLILQSKLKGNAPARGV